MFLKYSIIESISILIIRASTKPKNPKMKERNINNPSFVIQSAHLVRADPTGAGRAASCICITWCRGRESNPLNILTSSNQETPTYKRSVPPCPEVKGRAGRLAIGERDQ